MKMGIGLQIGRPKKPLSFELVYSQRKASNWVEIDRWWQSLKAKMPRKGKKATKNGKDSFSGRI